MALTITHIPECDAMLGPAQRMRGYQLKPGTSDYVTGGYPITAGVGGTNNLGGFEFLFGAWVIAVDNAEAIAYNIEFVFAAGAFATTPVPQSTIYMMFTQPTFSGTGANNEIPVGTNLSGVYVWAEFLGY